MKNLFIEGKIVNHDNIFEGRIEIDIQTGLIKNVGKLLGSSDLDCTDCLIFPGFGDLHVHAREDITAKENYKEDFLSASQAAINGGVAFFADMPNNPVSPVTDELYLAKKQLTEKSLICVTLYAGIGPSTKPLKQKVPYKVFMGPSVGDLFFHSKTELENVIKNYAGKNVSFHCEDPEILEQNLSAQTHENKRPPEAEISAVDFALCLIKKYNLKGKLCHFSTKQGLEKVVLAKKTGLNVVCEVTPHHLFFDSSHINQNTSKRLQMNPPLRDKENRLAMLGALKNGTIDFLATDHAPHTQAEKEKGVSGVPHLDTYGPFTTWLMQTQNFSAQDISKVCAFNPGKFINEFLDSKFGKGFGKIEPGFAGNLTIIDPLSPITITKDKLKTKCGWSPFENITFPGSVKYTVVAGKVYKI
jgi:dihydroorotase